MPKFSANGISYDPPSRPVVAICIDGCADEYLSTSLDRGRMPRVAGLIDQGWRGMVRAALPTFTNVNNAAIATGVPPSITGISGNFFLDPQSGQEVMMNSASYLRCETIFAAASQAGRKVAIVTAKEKLRDILSTKMDGIGISAEKASEARQETHGIDNVEDLVGAATPEIYSAEASLFVLRAGVALLKHNLADFLYLSLTDYMQHKFAPDEPESLDFYEGMDDLIGQLMDAGAIVAATADHGMNAKNNPDGTPNVIYLETLLNKRFGEGNKVICPITDPYVVHHGALGSFVSVHLADPRTASEVARWIWELDGVTEVLDRELAARKLELPADRVGDLVVLCGRHIVLGRAPEYHDLSALGGGLRSHGGRYEEMVPMLISEPLNKPYQIKAAGDPRNFNIFDFLCNGVQR